MDFVYCTFCLPMSSTSYFTKGWVLGSTLCYISGMLRYIVGFASWMAVAMIAISRCLTLISRETSITLFSSTSGKIGVFFTTWFLAVAYITPILTKVYKNSVRSIFPSKCRWTKIFCLSFGVCNSF